MKAIENIKNFYKSREKLIKLYYGYDKMRSEAKHKSK